MKKLYGIFVLGLVASGVGCGSGEKNNPLSSSDISISEFFASLDNAGEGVSGTEGAELTTNGFINNGDIKVGTINNAKTSCWADEEDDFCHTVLWEFKLSQQKTVDIVVDGTGDIVFYVFRYENRRFTAISDDNNGQEDFENDEDGDSSHSDYRDTSTFSQVLEKGTYFIAIGSYNGEDSYRLATVWY